MRVFNAQGEIVPHMLQQPATDAETNADKMVLVNLAYFPLRNNESSKPEQLRIKIDANAMAIDIASASGVTDKHITGYLINAKDILPKNNASIHALLLSWTSAAENFVGGYNVEASDDLKNWQRLVSNAPLADLNYGGASLLQNRIELPTTAAAYLRLSWPADQASLQLNSIQAELAAEKIAAPLNWFVVTPTTSQTPGEYAFDLGVNLPLRRMRFDLPQTNTLVNVSLLSRNAVDDDWQVRSHERLYALQRNQQLLVNADVLITGMQRYWLLRVDQVSGGLGAGAPVMHVGWHAQQLVFVARGAAPFQMAFGNSKLKSAEFNVQQLMLPGGNDTQKLALAQAGPLFNLGGSERLVPPPPSLPWKTWLLWCCLLLAVILLGGMAYRLIWQMNNAVEEAGKAKSANERK